MERTGRSRGFDRDFQYYDKGMLVDILDNVGYEMIWDKEVDDKRLQVVARVKDDF